MTNQMFDQPKIESPGDPDIVNAEIALKRAAIKAREIARKAGTSVVIFEDGEIREDPDNKNAHLGGCPKTD